MLEETPPTTSQQLEVIDDDEGQKKSETATSLPEEFSQARLHLFSEKTLEETKQEFKAARTLYPEGAFS